ncbi:Vanillate monooxygenase [Rhizorhabdus wittichii RW1]|uniref:Vanillate monooxygenase n=1 Tax=Rhizorhabdus wittichii (strain DSM 6014 / CCUG 31198 / JCM 15750 / NBRC 105917 / EY 4224 / RW1) TaxID=392499 RepID=A0A9J9LFM0_RHIWR|nr:Vanillate monooxygenase [Rhizorhabdus wittichii RW1]
MGGETSGNFLRNAWYMFAWGEEVADAPLGRTIAGEELVCFRGKDGLVVLADRCPHRFVPLSLGSVADGVLECAYHGLRFGSDGRCMFNPLGDPPERAVVRSYPVVERDRVIWVWTGDPALADPDGIADFSFLADPARATVTGYAHVRADYQLAIDNLSDLTHVQFVHRDYQASEAYHRLVDDTWQDGDVVHRSITFPNGRPAPFLQSFLGPDKLIDFTMETRWTLPSNIKLSATVTEPGAPDQYLIGNHSAHLVTPEADGSCHYFYAHSRDYGVGDPEADEKIREWQRVGFGEQDKPVLEAQQRRVGHRDIMELRPVILPTDAGGVRARRILAQRIARERKGAMLEAVGDQ